MVCEVCGLPGEKCKASCCQGEGTYCPAHDHRAQEFLDGLGMHSGTFCEFDYPKIVKAVRAALHAGAREAFEDGDYVNLKHIAGVLPADPFEDATEVKPRG
jgi:hypothetical protein